MELAQKFKNKGYSFANVIESDLKDYIYIENLTHTKYILEHSEFLGEYKESLIVDTFNQRRNMTFFKKLILNGETVGFFSYDETFDQFEKVCMRLVPETQSQGLGTWFLRNLMEMAEHFDKIISIVAVKTNLAQELYKRLGFEVLEIKGAFCFLQYTPHTGRK